MKFPRDKQYDSSFSKIPDIKWYPYVGQDFGTDEKRTMVYAHNIPLNQEEYEEKAKRWTDVATWANQMEDYTYQPDKKNYTKAFRSFIKAAVGLKQNYGSESPDEVLNLIDTFVRRIAYLNFIQDTVISETNLVQASGDQINRSKEINKEVLSILEISHCICWGKHVYNYVKSLEGFQVVSERPEGRRGFSSCTIDTGNGLMKALRIFHPSMPGFGVYNDSTQKIISDFLGLN